jgi:GntR family transcriptional regulator
MAAGLPSRRHYDLDRERRPMSTDLPLSPPTVDRSASAPAHVQIATWLRGAISRGDLLPGRRLPGERDLAALLGVSRMTLRQALAELEASGELVRVAGRAGGAFIAEPRVEVDLTHLTGLTDQVRRAGRRAGARVLSARRVVPTHEVSTALGLSARAQAYEVVRVRSASGVPLALERSWFPARLFPGLTNHSMSGSMYGVLRTRYGRPPVSADEHLSPARADDESAAALGVAVGDLLMQVRRTARDADGTAIEHAHDLFRPDRVSFLVRRTPDAPTTLRALT